MSDLISRQAAIYAIEKRMDDITCEEFAEGMSEAITEISLLPSAQPERKTGKWIDDNCSVCGQYVYHGDARNYCPNCGAKMKGEEE